MATVCQIYDETLGSVLFDLNDPTGANALDNGYTSTDLLANVDLGSPAQEFTRFSPPMADGGSTVNQRAGFRTVTLPFRMRAATYDGLAQAMGRLTQYLNAGCVIRWQANNSSNVRYLDVEPSSAPYVLDGRELSSYLATSLVDTPDGLIVQVTAQPYLRGSTLLENTNLFTNATLLRDADGAFRPDGWTWSVAPSNETITDTTTAYQFDFSATGNRSLTQSTGAATAAVGETWTLSGEARVTSSAMTNGRAEAMMTWRTSAPADISTIASGLVSLTPAWQKFSITGVAPATTDRIQGGLRVNSSSATLCTYQLRNVQVEKAAAATPFHVGRESFTVEPEPTSGVGRLVPIWNPGDAPTPIIVSATQTSGNSPFLFGPYTGDGLITMLNTANVVQIEDGTNGTDTAGSVQANASPGTGTSAKLTTFATVTALGDRTAVNVTTGLSALKGRTLIPMLRLGAGTATYFGRVEVKFDYGNSGDVVTMAQDFTTGLATGANYVEIPLGVITFPDVTTSTLQLTFRASRTSGTGQLIWDALTWVPADAAAYIVPGTANTSMVSDLANNIAYNGNVIGTTSGRVEEVRGPLPMLAPPGLSLLYMTAGTDASAITEYPYGAMANMSLTNARSIRFQLTPRYYG